MIMGTAGCIAQPTVAVTSVQIGSLTPASTTLQVLVSITNPNSFDIPLENVSFMVYSVEAAGLRPLGEGATGPFTLPGRQTIDKTVPVTLDNAALLQAALTAVRAGQDRMTFRVEGTVTGSLYGIVTVNVPFQGDRTITLQEMLGMAGVPVSEQQVQQAFGMARSVISGAIPGLTIRIGGA